MICPHCHSSLECRVIDSRERDGYVYRRRVCQTCGFRFSTQESFKKASSTWIYGDAKPRVLGLNEFSNWNQALWLEIKARNRNILAATSVRAVTDTTVEFCNEMIQSKDIYGKQWRAWTSKPFESDFAEYEWGKEE